MRNKLSKTARVSVKGLVSLFVIPGILALNSIPVFADEPATVTVKTTQNVNIRIYGFVETDLINDSTQPGFYEESDTPAIPKPNTYAGNNGRTIMSVRNSRLGFDFTMPPTEAGLKSEAILEFDLRGNQAANTSPGTAGGTQSERDFFCSPTIRVRHAYLNLTSGAENLKFGQTWSLFAWQPYYFPSEPIVAPSAGELYRRYPQIRATDSRPLGIIGLSDWTLESAADIAKPAEMDSELTDFHAGARISSNKCKAATGLSSGSNMVGLSLASSWVWIPITTAKIGNQTGQGYALDALIPIIPSKDGKDMSNNLSLTAEYSNATGVGGLELAGANAGVTAPTAAQMGTTSPLDSGIAGINIKGSLELIQFETFRANLTYVMPSPKWAVSTGYAEARPDNIGDFAASASCISLYQYYYGSLFYTPLQWLRFGLEYAEFHDTYTDLKAPNAQDNRIQFTTYLTF